MHALIGKTALLFLSLLVAGTLNAQCLSGFTYTMGPNGQVNFSSTSTAPNPIIFYFWDFGDGGSASGASVSHTYTSPGLVVVSHYSGDSIGCKTAYMDSLVIGNIPCTAPVSFNLYKDTTQVLTWVANPSYPSNVVSVTWSWGDGNTSSGLYPSHTYSAAGSYSVCVTVSVSCGATNTFCINKYVNRSSESSDMLTLNVLNASGATTSIGKIKTNSLARASVSPNPVSDKAVLNVYSEAGASYEIRIYDVAGKLLSTDVLKAGPGLTSKDLNMASLESGLYFISLSNSIDHKTLRVIKD